MWSVTEQNHLHYPAVMFHRFRLVHWWPPTHPADPLLFLHSSSLLFFYCSMSRSSVNARLWTAAAFFKTFFHSFPVYFTLRPSISFFSLLPSLSVVSELYCIIFLWRTCSHISSSHLALPWDVAICLYLLARLLLYYLPSSSQFRWAKSQLLSAIFSFLRLISSL